MPRVEVSIGSLAPGGDGVGHVELEGERRAVFVRGAAPGDRVVAEVDFARRPAAGRALELLQPGPGRVESPCAHAARCGGCDWMHLSAATQAEAHLVHVRAALPQAWRESDIAFHGAAERLGQRVRARVHVVGARGPARVGMHETGTRDPVPVDRCVVLAPALDAVRGWLPALFAACEGRGDVGLALGADRLPVLEIAWEGTLPAPFFARLEHATGERRIAGARVLERASRRPARVGDPTPWTLGADGAPLRLAPGGFAQAAEGSNALLVQHVARLAEASRGERAVELYAGAGNLTVLLAPTSSPLVAVESDPAACDAARANLASRALDARVTQADASTYEWHPLTRLVVLDPPRTGARAVATRLAASRVPRVVYVSCDPQTLGRDLATLATSYELRSAAVFDMFPQTSHVETVVELARVRGRS